MFFFVTKAGLLKWVLYTRRSVMVGQYIFLMCLGKQKDGVCPMLVVWRLSREMSCQNFHGCYFFPSRITHNWIYAVSLFLIISSCLGKLES